MYGIFLDFKKICINILFTIKIHAGMQEKAMAALTQEQIDKFWSDGVLVVEDAVSAKNSVIWNRCLKAGWRKADLT